MLEYENQLFLDLLHEDGLLILARGLGLERIFLNILKVYGEAKDGPSGNLVLVLGTKEEEEEYFIQNAGHISIRRVTSEISTNERSSMYKNGGIYFMSTRILTVDLLTDRLPCSLVTGLLVYRAHTTADSCQESFVLRLYRQKNKTGFIKAFSDSPNYFKSGGFRKTEHIMRNLFVKNLFLCPRFQLDVCSALEKNPPEVIELHLHMTKDMMTLQTAILDLMDYTLKETKRINPHLYTEDEETLNVENAISKFFIKHLQRELDPIWHRLSWKTKQLIQDLKTLRTLLLFLSQYDAVTFYGLVSALRTTENAMKTGGWMLLDAAETLFLTAESRITGDQSGAKKSKTDRFTIEENPKWLALSDIIREIKEEIPKDSFPTEKILILVSDPRTARQLEEYLYIGAQKLLRKLFNKSIVLTDKFGRLDNDGVDYEENKSRKNKGIGKKSTKKTDESQSKNAEGTNEVNFPESPLIIVQSFQVDPFERFKVLNELKPRFVIMYDVDLTTVRQLEVFQANEGPDFKIRVYFMFYGKSTEEQTFLTTIRTEKESFEHLIKEKQSMVIPEDREGRSEITFNADLLRGSDKASDAILAKSLDAASSKSRQGGGLELREESPKIIVDMREFRCELPSLIHKRGIDIEPITLEVGDYILTPEICVERKSISDLIGSLNSGRLYTQATSMTRFYSKPMLLIEFDKNKPFALQGRYYMSRDIASSDVVMRLQLLTLHFPKLIILWSPSPHATAEIFEELKKGRDQPDSSRAASISIDIADEFRTEKFNPAVFDFVSKLPGVTTRNVYSILNSVRNVGDLLELSEEGLADLLDSKAHGKLLHEALHCKMEASEPPETKKSSTSRFKHKIKKKP